MQRLTFLLLFLFAADAEAAELLTSSYGVAGVTVSGPAFERVTIEDRVHFSSATGLSTRDGAPPSHFEIAAADGQFVEAAARIDGSTVILSHSSIDSPQQVRFAWHEEAEPNLVNGAGLPTSAFRGRRH